MIDCFIIKNLLILTNFKFLPRLIRKVTLKVLTVIIVKNHANFVKYYGSQFEEIMLIN